MTKLVFNAETLAKSINSENGNEIVFEEYFDIQKSEGENPKDPKFEYFKKKILDHLAELEKKENHSIAKAIDIDEWIQKANFPVGTVRTWNGQKFKKITPKKWARVYETESRGAKLAVAALRRKAAACRNSEELLQLCLENKERFVDGNGKPLAFMQEFSAYVSSLNDKNEGGKGKTLSDWKGKDNFAEKEQGDKETSVFSNKDLSDRVNKGKKLIDEYLEKYLGDKNISQNLLDLYAVGDAKRYVSVNYNGTFYKNLSKEQKKQASEFNEKLEQVLEEYASKRLAEKQNNTSEAETKQSKQKNEPKPVGRGDFGNIYDCFKHKAKEAIEFLLKNKGGEAIGALKHKDVGDIDLVWGEEGTSHSDGFGLAKLAKYHPEVLDNLQEVIDDMEVTNKSKNRVQLESKSHKASVRLTWNGKLKNWLLTAFEKNSGVSDSSTDIARTDGSRKNDTAPLANTADSTIPQNGGKSSGIESIREKYQSSKSIDGDEDEIYIGKETISGKWKLVEADAPSASHDEITFHKTEGFPTAKDGSTVNDRDYEHDTAAQETVIDIASDFDGRALGFDSPIVVTQDGVVTSGNNRTMSSKIAARKGTDTKYIEALKKRAKKFGFSADDVAKFKHPRVVFETEHTGDYTTNEFAKYNESGKKAMNPVEKAVKVSKMIQPQTIEDVASIIGEFDTMGDLYADKKASQSIFNTLIQSNIIQKTDLPQYYSDNTVTASGKEFLETVLIGSVINETNIRQLNTEGGRSIRQKLVRAITPLIENKGMKGYSINKELNEAVGIAIEVAHHKDQFPNVEAFSKQQDMFRKLDPVSLELAKKLEGTQKGFAEFMLDMNGGLRPAANGEVDIFLGECESKEDIVNRVLNIKKTVEKALSRFFRIFGTTM